MVPECPGRNTPNTLEELFQILPTERSLGEQAAREVSAAEAMGASGLFWVLGVAVASGEEGRQFFTLIGRTCIPGRHEQHSHPKVAASPSECRMWCAQQPTCKTVQVTLEDSTAMCELFTSFENAHGPCSQSACCYYKGIPPRPIDSGATIWATENDERPPSEQMGAENISNNYRRVSLPLMLCITFASMVLLGTVSLYVSQKRKRAAVAAEAASRIAQADMYLALQRKVDALPTSVCATRGFVACLGKNLGADVEMGVAPTLNHRSDAEALAPGSSPPGPSASILSRTVGLEVFPSLLSKALRTFSVADAPLAAKDRGEDDDGDECAMCMVVYEPGDSVRHLPCKHFYHKCCIDRWLVGGADRSCPLCKTDPFEAWARLTAVASCSSNDTSVHTSSFNEASFQSSACNETSLHSCTCNENSIHSSSSVDGSSSDLPAGRVNPRTPPASPQSNLPAAEHVDAPASAATASDVVAPASPAASRAVDSGCA